MKKLFIVLGSVVAVLLVAVVGLAVWVLTFDPNENKDWIAEKFREQTGRELTLGGNIELDIYPWLGINARDISVGNATGFSSEPLLSAGHVAFRIKLLPILSGRYEIDTVTLDGVRVLLEVRENGQNNWASFTAGEASDSSTASTGDSGPLLNNLIIGGVNITDTSLIYDDRFADQRYEVSDFNLQIGELVYGEPLDINMSFLAASSTPELAADANMNGVVRYDMDQGRYDLAPLQLNATLSGPTVPAGAAELSLATALSMDLEADTLNLDNLQLNAFGTTIAMQLEASGVQSSTPAVRATLEARGDDLAVLFRVLEQNELAERISSLDSSFTVLAELEADSRSGRLTLPTLQARLLNAEITSDLLVERFNTETPLVAGTLSAAGPDLPTLVEVLGMFQGGSASPLSQIGRDMRQVPERSFSIQSRFSADMQAATVEVPELEINLLGTTLSGTANASNINDSEKLSASGKLDARGPDLPLLLQLAGQLQGDNDNALYQYGEQLRLGVQDRAFTLSTDFNADMARGNIELPTFSASMLGFNMNATLNARNLQSRDSLISGSFSLQGENLREVLSALDQADLAEVAQSVDLSVEVGGSSNNLRLSPLQFTAVLAGDGIPNSPQTLTLDADTTLNLDTFSLNADSFSLRGLGLNLSGNVEASNINSTPTFSGEITLPSFNARAFMEQLNQSLPPMADDTVLEKVALRTAFGGSSTSFNLNRLQLEVDESTISGDLAISDLESMATTFAIHIDRIDADRYMAPATEEVATADSEAAPLPLDTLRALTIDGKLNVDELVVSKLQMNDIEIQLRAADGQLALNPFRADLYEGSFNGDIRLDARGSTPAASLSTQLQAVNLEPLLMDFMEASYATGIANIDLRLSGQGADTPTIKQSLRGAGSLQLEDGVLTGVDVSAVLNTVETMIRSRRVLDLPQGGSTPFEESAATLDIRNGVVSTEDLSIKAPGWKLSGNGTLVDLGLETIDFRLLVEIDEATVTSSETEYDLGGYSLPIACRGSIDGPRCLPDAEQIIAAAVTTAVQERLGNFLQERLGTPQQNQGQQPPGTAPDGSTGDVQPLVPDETTDAPEAAPQTTEDAAEQLINRALDRFFGN